MNNLELKKLKGSKIAQCGKDCEVINLYPDPLLVDTSFHPNGKCGCVELDDDYLFGIRCNHLIWIDGRCEGIEPFWTKEDHEEGKYESILLIGNHKGLVETRLLIFHSKPAMFKSTTDWLNHIKLLMYHAKFYRRNG